MHHTILSVQSHVASGYVGNRSAVFPLQLLECEVVIINTVQFSNHTGYGTWTGDIFSPQHIQSIVDGLEQQKVLQHVDGVLSGYQGKPDLGSIIIDTVKKLKSKSNNVLYCCDPVLGDTGRGVYVLPETAEFIKNKAIFEADIITPNQYELGYLTNRKIHTLQDVRNACNELHEKGPNIILVTSLRHEQSKLNTIEMLVSANNTVWHIVTPYFNFKKEPSGSGDATAAIFFANYLNTKDIVSSLELTTAAMYALIKKTHECNSYELAMVAAQEDIKTPKTLFKASKLTFS